MIEELVKVRRYLHSNPELSGEEKQTAAYIIELLKETKPDRLLTSIGGYGIIAFYEGSKPGKTIAFRADMDALPIIEANTFAHKSTSPGVFHGCGHDGHTTIAIGLARKISKSRDDLQGTIAILFQPAEETGTGANCMLQDDKMNDIHFDSIFALHNLPGFEKNSIVLRKEVFASSSIGVKIYLKGSTSHAGHPEYGNSPVRCMTALIDALNGLPQMLIPLHKAALVTVIHARLGEIAFGTTPGDAVVMATLRAHNDDVLDAMKDKLQVIVKGLATTYDLDYKVEWVEYFPALNNNSECVEAIKAVVGRLGLNVVEKDYPFAWSEDFAFFTQRYEGALFGLGAGLDHPQVHKDDYDFPDELLETGVSVFWELINESGKSD